MHLYTFFQLVGLAVLWTVKSFASIALAFPFFIVAMIPYRHLLGYFFTEKEMDAVSALYFYSIKYTLFMFHSTITYSKLF